MTTKSILIVEDEAIIALDLSEKIEEMGFRVAGRADSGEKAVRLANERNPDLVLMDISIKGSIDGIDTAALIRRTLKIPVVFMTSFRDGETLRRAAQTGPFGYLTKPYNVKELRAGIEVALRKDVDEEPASGFLERWFKSTLRCAEDAVIATNLDGLVEYLNIPAERLTGWGNDEARGCKLEEVLKFRAAEPEPPRIPGEAATGVRNSRVLLNRSGDETRVYETAGELLEEQGQRIGTVVRLRDAAAPPSRDEQLRTCIGQYAEKDRAPGTARALLSMSGDFVYVNDAFAALLKRNKQALLAASDPELTHGDDREAEKASLFELLVSDAAAVDFGKRYLLPAGEPAAEVFVHASLESADGEPLCYCYEIRPTSGTENSNPGRRTALDDTG